ncbi:MAG: hypothetical protein ACK4SY_09970 [Pyrobaculum sp.]
MGNIYLGSDSCYARAGLDYVHGSLNPNTAGKIARKILHELRYQGWTFERGTCRRIKMTPKLAEKRLKFLAFLLRKNGYSPAVVRKYLAALRRRSRDVE